MRAMFIILGATVLALNTAQAQKNTPKKLNRFGVGVFGGLNYSVPIIRTRFPDHFNSQNTWVVGTDLNYRLSQRTSLHIQPSLTTLSNKKFNGGYTSLLLDATILKIPVVYRYYILPSQKLFIEAGAAYNQITKSSYRREIIVNCIAGPCPSDLYGPEAPILNQSATSGLAGIGVNIPIQKISIPVTLRYERYVTNHIFSGDDYNPPTPVRFENFSLTTGVNF